MRIGLTYNLKPADAARVANDDAYEEFDSLETIEAIESSLRACGHEPVRLGWGVEMLDALEANQPIDGVFNLAEGIGGRGRESQVPATLELLGIPYTASDALPIGITLDKALAKLVARSAGIPTAPWSVVRGAGDPALDEFIAANPGPWFAKPAGEGSSMGITESSLCRDAKSLRATVARLLPYGPVLVEEYLPGEEYTVGIVGGEVLAVMQVVPRNKEADFIYSLEVKRDYQNLVDYELIDDAGSADESSLTPGLVAQAVFELFGLHDVARVDVRRDRDGVPNFVEVNPLPGLHPVNSDLVIMARAAGWTHERIVAAIMASAEARWRE